MKPQRTVQYRTPLNTFRQRSVNTEPSKTKQEFKDDCDPTNILKKYQATGLIEHHNQYEPVYGDQTSMTYHESKQITADAETMFNDLPSETRKHFDQDVGKFLDYVQSQENIDILEKGKLTPSQLTPKASQLDTSIETPAAEADIIPEKDPKISD